MTEKLPPRASLEFLRKRAKTLLRTLREARPDAKLADAQFELAHAYGFSSWRALKTHVDTRRLGESEPFFSACDAGVLAEVTRLLDADPTLVHERHTHVGRTALHRAAVAGNAELARLLLARGADPNARDECDLAYPHHYAAEAGRLEIVLACLEHGGDPGGEGDAHQSGVIGWASCLRGGPHPEVVELLLERGARHHVFSAVATGALDAIQGIVEADASALERKMSRFEHAQTPLHLAARRGTPRTIELLLTLGAELEAVDDQGRTPLTAALLADRPECAAALRAAGAREPRGPGKTSFEHVTPVLPVRDFARAMKHYQEQLGFKKKWEWGAPPSFGCVERDSVNLFLGDGGWHGAPGVAVYVEVESVDALHREYLANGVKIREAPEDKPWGSRSMVAEDIDGNQLRFGS